MDQRSPQNIDELLQKLSTMVDQTEAVPESEHSTSATRVSDVSMQEELKKRYLDDSSAYASQEEDDDYVLDDDFLRELNSASTKKRSSSRAHMPKPNFEEGLDVTSFEVFAEEPIIEEAVVEEIVEEPIIEEAVVEEIVEEAIAEEEIAVQTSDEIPPWEAPIEEELIEEELVEEELIEEEPIEEDLIEEELIEEEVIEEALVEEELIEEEVIEEDLVEEEPADDTVLEEPVMHAMNLSALGVHESDESTDDIADAAIEEEISAEETFDDIDLMFETSRPQKRDADTSIVDLLLQFGCDDELEETVEEESISQYFCAEGSDVPYDPTASYAYDGKEYVNTKQNEAVHKSYHHLFVSSVHRLVSVAALTVLVWVYDFLPLFSVEFPGILDYEIYPVAYMLIGLQLLLICCLPVWKSMLRGLRSLWEFRLAPYTVAAASLIAVALYDLSSLHMTDRRLPPVFHFAAALAILIATVCDHLLLCRERSAFRVYSAEGTAYTLLKSGGKESVAEKMRRGGLPNSHTVRVPADVTFPNCYFRSVCEDAPKRSVMRFLLVPTILASVLCGVLSMLLGKNLFSSLSAIFVLLLAALPSSAILVDSIVLYVAAIKLERKGCAIAGKGSIARYADTNVLVFRDRHLFASCRSEDVGIVLYDKTNAGQAMSCLKVLYDRVGGPMASVLEHVPSEYSADDVKIVRMFRNGIEAVIARKHVLIVGDRTFMERYGFDFSDTDGEPRSEGRATLCVSFDGVMSAKLTVKYTLEPLFEVLVERLAAEHVYCAVETQDPLINSRMAARLRKRGSTPISIVHKSAKDVHRVGGTDSEVRKEPTGILARRSRLRLCELVIFCKRLCTVRRRITVCTVIGSALSFAIAATLLLTGLVEWVNQYLLLLCHTITSALLLTVALFRLPPKDYISLASYDHEHGADDTNL